MQCGEGLARELELAGFVECGEGGAGEGEGGWLREMAGGAGVRFFVEDTGGVAGGAGVEVGAGCGGEGAQRAGA